MVKVYRSPKDS